MNASKLTWSMKRGRYVKDQNPIVVVNTQGVDLELNLDDPWNLKVLEAIQKSGSYEYETTKLIQDNLKKGDTFLDLGANIGYFTLLAARIVGREGKVHSFEPYPPARGQLSGNVTLNRVTNVMIHPEALSNRDGRVSFYVSKGDTSLNNMIGPIGPNAQQISVPVGRVDDLVPRDLVVDLAKMDIEGEEFNALEGMVSLIARSPNLKLLLEYNISAAERTKSDPQELLDRLNLWFDVFKAKADGKKVVLKGPIKSTRSINERMCMLWCVKRQAPA